MRSPKLPQFALACTMCACGVDGGASPPIPLAVSDSGAGNEGGFTPAPHPPEPTLSSEGGPVIRSIALVTISFPNYEHETEMTKYADDLVQSTWLAQVGRDYGVGRGTHVHVTVSDAPPQVITSTSAVDLVEAKIDAGEVPPPSPSGVLYAVLYPSAAALSPDVGTPCAMTDDEFVTSYHDQATGNVAFPYAVVPSCASEALTTIELALSHELIEAAADPDVETDPAFGFPWGSGEVADMCNEATTVDGLTVTRVWSNTAAATGGDPCIPSAGEAYFNVTVAGGDPTVAAGSTRTFAVTGWSTQPVTWSETLRVTPYGAKAAGAGALTAELSEPDFTNGSASVLTISAPMTAPPGRAFDVALTGAALDGSAVRPQRHVRIAVR